MIPRRLAVIMVSFIFSLVFLWALAEPAPSEAYGTENGRGIIGLKPGTDFEILADGLIAAPGASDAEEFNIALLRTIGLRMKPLFNRSRAELRAEREELAAASTAAVPQLDRWLQFEVPAGMKMSEALAALRLLPIVETAYARPTAYPASTTASSTPSFVSYQGYLDDPPGGLGVKQIWEIAGGNGRNIWVADVEGDWNVSHEDLRRAKKKNIDGAQVGGQWLPHGTAVLGTICGTKNGFGVTGITYRVKPYMYSIFRNPNNPNIDNVPDAINEATKKLRPGDVILIEVQYRPGSINDYVPVEYYDADFEAIQAAVAKGIVVVEAAANGSQNLDANKFEDKFNVKVRGDSGAIMVGAGTPPGYYGKDRSRLSFSNYGQRVDVQNWGEIVATTGFNGSLYSKGGQNSWYTVDFNGTSSASALTAACVASLQGMAKKSIGRLLTPAEMRDLLIDTGNAQKGVGKKTQHIGPRPDLVKAAAEIAKMATSSASKSSHDPLER